MLRSLTRNVAAPTAALFAFAFSSAASAAGGDPTGVWLDDTGRGAIEITKCGSALCGRVVWVKAGKDSKGCGKEILGAVKPVGKGRWDGGWIYSPEHGRKFDVELTPVGNDRLRVMGYAGVRFLSQTRTWTRAPTDLVRCDSQIMANASPGEKPDAASPQAAAATSAPATEVAATTTADASLPPVSGESASTIPSDTASTEMKPDAAVPAAAAATAAAGAATKGESSDKPRQKANAAAKQQDDGDEEPPRRKSRLSELKLDKVLKRTGKGTCKLDLPWVKVDFDCRDL